MFKFTFLITSSTQFTRTFVIVLIDTEVPKLTCVEGQSTEIDEGKPTAMVTWNGPIAEDNSGDISITCDPASGTNFDIGQTTVTCNAVDGSGNEIICHFQVNVTGT